SDRPGLLTKDLLVKIIDEKRVVAAPKVEIIKAPDFKPLGKDIPSEFKIRNVEVHKTVGTVLDFTHYFNDRLQKIRGFLQEGRGSRMSGLVKSIDAIKQYASGKEVTVVGMVYDKIITKNGHVLITLEDETGSAKILFAKQDKRIANSLFENSNRIIVDEVIAVRGKLSGSLLIASELVYPDIPVHNRKATEEDVAIAFMSDVHVGSKLFMEKQFLRFIEWVNGGLDYRKDLAQKIKYITVSGDLVDGIGVYPDQQKELAIDDIYKQYNELFNLFSKVPDYIEIFLITGNHDGVQRAEPQPQLPEGFYKDFRHLQNIHLVTNPGYININGLQVLGYHGTSLDSIIQGIPGCSYSKPETAMLEVLKRRHLSPIYGDNPIVPGKGDSMVIDQVPDILHMGHLHKNGSAEHHGTLIVNSGTWQGRTSFQVRMGHVPTPAILPIYETKSMKFQQMDFNMQT
ncbi:MAG: DNA-directed DNA polymerase II small subunit, partial [Candidatus Micrarchaeota archaeon]|nr:DNA-directed DNA polymerase II small subunit [Candidatus Micrarchaeota archaeon]